MTRASPNFLPYTTNVGCTDSMGSQSSRPEPEIPTMPQEESKIPPPTDAGDDDEPDEW